MTATAASEPVRAAARPPADPPHGGSWERLPDGSLRLLHATQPTHGRARTAPVAQPDQPKE